jgi:hypothetical protein
VRPVRLSANLCEDAFAHSRARGKGGRVRPREPVGEGGYHCYDYAVPAFHS